MQENTFNRWGKPMQIILVKLTLYVTEKCQKANISPFICWQNPFNVKQMPPKNLTISMPYLPQAQPALALLLLAWYCGFTTICRRNGNCVDPNQTDSYRAG